MSEEERIKKMVNEGRISQTEGDRLLSAVENITGVGELQDNQVSLANEIPKSNLCGILSLVFVLFALLATVLAFAFQDADWMNEEALLTCSLLVCLVGTILGWTSYKTQPGKVGAILGSVMMALYLFVLTDGAAPDSRDYDIEIGKCRLVGDRDVLIASDRKVNSSHQHPDLCCPQLVSRNPPLSSLFSIECRFH